MKSCGMEIVKYLLFFFNLLFTVSGVAIIVAGSLVLAEVGGYRNFLEGNIVGPPIVLIVLGIIIFLVASLGCCGAIRESVPMLVGYAVLLAIIFISELAVGVTAAVAKDQLNDALKISMRRTMNDYYNTTVEKAAWDTLQREMMCCGVDGASDWKKPTLPPSCCPDKVPATPCIILPAVRENEITNYKDGCFLKLKEKVSMGALMLASVGIGIAFIELAGIVLAIFMAASIRKNNGGGEEGGGDAEAE